ncbi:MAG TPA: hypothetical protein DCE56_07360, partial [Cyanobacteria bacterium UBA8553]|nr:hypothetical protein [Cyanobacteria bacterium UBA8553]
MVSTTQATSKAVQPFARLIDRDRLFADKQGDSKTSFRVDDLTGNLGLSVTLFTDMDVLFPESSVYRAAPNNSSRVKSFIQNTAANRSVNFTVDTTQTRLANPDTFVTAVPEAHSHSEAFTYDSNIQSSGTQNYQTLDSPTSPVTIGNLETVLKQLAASTSNSPFSKLYVFGDSLSDPGNIYNSTTFVQPIEWLFGVDIPVIPPPPYYEGRYSNGLIWADYLAKDLGLTITPSTDLSVFHPLLPFSSPITITGEGLRASPYFKGATTNQSINFAYGGAQTGFMGSDEQFGQLIPGLLTQVGWFKNDHQRNRQSADPNALYVVWAGANDYWSVENPNPEESVNNIETAIASLYDLGARNFLVPNLPDLGMTPFAFSGGTQESDRLTNLTEEHNFLLDTTLEDLDDSLTDINLISLDVYSIFNNAITHPQHYGYTNVTEPSLDSVTMIPSGSPDNYLFWDKVHPTSITHERLAEFALA